MRIFRNYLQEFIEIPPNCWSDLSAMSFTKSFNKNEYITRQENNYNREVFIVRGIVRGFFIDDHGNDKIVAFYQGAGFMSTNSMRSKNGLSIYSLQALTEVDILEFSTVQFIDFLNKYPEFLNVVKHVKEQELDRLNKRELCLMEISAEDKYKRFKEYYPEIENVIPHYNIASYLGITAVTLSRVRQK